MKELGQDTWRAQIIKDTNAIIIDVRTKEECNTGIVENAILIDFLKPALFLEEVANTNAREIMSKPNTIASLVINGSAVSTSVKILSPKIINSYFE